MYPTFGDAMRVDPKRPLGSFDPLVRKTASYNEFWTSAGIPGKNLKHITDRPRIGNFDSTKNIPEDNQLYDYMSGFLTVHADATGLMSLGDLTTKYLKSDSIGPAMR